MGRSKEGTRTCQADVGKLFAFEENGGEVCKSAGGELDACEARELGEIRGQVGDAVSTDVELGEGGELRKRRRQLGQLIAGHIERLEGT